MKQPTIGFIGLGLMGSAMVARLQQQDDFAIGQLFVLANRSRQAIDAAIQRGATEVESGRVLAEKSDIIMLCMDTSDSVESRMLGDDGIIAGLSAGKVVIDFGTSLPDSTRRLGLQVAAQGAAMLDAPLGRTPAHAQDGKLNIMASGERNAFDNVRAVLEVLGENVFYFGALGTGHTIKLINNFYGMTVATAMAEAFAVGEAAGIDGQQLYDVMSAGPSHSPMMDLIKAYAVDGDREALQFSVGNARKDVVYYSAMTDAMGIPSLMSAGTKQSLGLASSEGYANRHVSEMVDLYRRVVGDKNESQ